MRVVVRVVFVFMLCCTSNGFSFWKYYFKYYTPTNGLLSLKVAMTVQDAQGYIWFATSSGLMRYDGYRYKTFLIQDGIPSNVVTHLYVDGDVLWVATLKGLCFIHTKTLKITTTNIKNKIYALYRDNQKRMWVSQESDRVNERLLVFERGTLKGNPFTKNNAEFPYTTVTAIYESTQGVYWFGTNNGVYRIDPAQLKGMDFYGVSSGFPAKSVTVILEHQGKILFGTNDGLVFLQGKKFTKQRLSRTSVSYKVSGLLRDASGRIWVATNKGIHLISQDHDMNNIQSYTVEQGLSHNEITHIFEDREESIWISTNGGGVAKLYEKNVIHYDIRFEGQSRGIYSIIENRKDNVLWFGGEGIIAHFDQDKEWTVASQETVVGGNYIKNIFLDTQGELWFLANDISHLLPSDRVLPYSRDFFFNEAEVLSYLSVKLSDAPGEIWFGTAQGLFVFWDQDTEVPIRQYISAELDTRSIVSLLADEKSRDVKAPEPLDLTRFSIQASNPIDFLSQSLDARSINLPIIKRPQSTVDIWIATESHGLFILDKNRQLRAYAKNEELLQRDLRKLFQDSSGNIWILSANGVSVIDYKTQALKHYSRKNGLSADFVWDIMEDHGGNIWLATNGGGITVFMKNNTIQYFSKKNGLSDDFVYSIRVDKNAPESKRVWIVTNYSLDYYDGKRFTSYTAENGLNGDLLGEATPLFIDSKHNVWLGTSKGVTQIRHSSGESIVEAPQSRGKRGSAPNPLLQNTFVNQQPYDLVNGASLDYDQNYLLFEFVSLSFKDEKGVRYQYYLEGFDEGWSLFTKSSTARYDNLPSGDYTLRVRAQNQIGEWSEKYFHLDFSIALPFWQHPFFILGMIVFVSVGIYVTYKWNVKRLEQENIILEGKVQQRTKELSQEKERSDKLLLNVLPEVIAEELKQTGYTVPRSYDCITVIFTDFLGFTKLAEHFAAQELVMRLEEYFAYFDDVSKKRNLEKLKTIGDSYMAAGGIPEVNSTNPIDAVLAANDFREFVQLMMEKHGEESSLSWNIRIGIHTGAVVAGVVGKTKFAYDIWGDAVNVASRMESSGVPGRINISAETYQYVKEFFECEYRGLIQAKNKGVQEMYFVESLKPEYQKDSHAFEPNEAFWAAYQNIKAQKSK